MQAFVVALASLGSSRRCGRSHASVRRAAGRVIEALEDRTLFAWNLAIGLTPTQNVAATAAGGTVTYTAVGSGASLDWSDVTVALAAGNSVVISSGTSGAEAGNITDNSGVQSGLIPQNLNLTLEAGSGTGLVGNISLQDVVLNGSNASITINANGSVSAGLLSSGTSPAPAPLATVLITAADGSILSSSAKGTIDATTLALESSIGIGTPTAPLPTHTAHLSAQTATGGIYVSNIGNLTLNDGVIPGVRGVHDTTSGDINLANSGDITVDTNGDNVIGSSNVSLTTTGGGNILLGGNNGNSFDSFTGSVASTGGTVTLNAAGNLLIGDTSTATFGNIEGGGSIVLNAGGNINIDDDSSVSAHGTGTITATAGGNLSILNTNSRPTLLATQGGAITLGTGPGGTLTVDGDGTFYGNQHTLNTTRNGGNGNITINADHFVLGLIDDIVAGTGTVSIQPVTATEAIQLGTSTDSELDLSNFELQRIIAGTLRIGSMANTGGISVTGGVEAFDAPTISLLTGGSISDAGPFDYLGGTNMALEAGGSIGSPGAPFSTGVRNIVAKQTAPGGGITITNGVTNLTIGFPGAPFGGMSAFGGISIANQGSILVTNQEVNTSGQINFDATGPNSDIQVASDGIVLADGGVVAHADRDVLLGVPGGGGLIYSDKGAISVTAGRDVILDNSAQIKTDFESGNISVSAGRDLTIESTSGSKNTFIGAEYGGDISLTTGPGGAFTLDAGAGGMVANLAPYNPGNITITSDDMVINDPIYDGKNTVTLQQASTTARNIDLGLGTTPGDLNLTSAAITQITAQTLLIGRRDNPGNILLTAPVTTPLLGYGNPGTLVLLAGRSIGSAAPADTVTVPDLTLQASTGIGTSANPLETAVSVLAARTETGGIYINNSGNLSIGGGPIPAVGGIWNTAFGDIRLENTGSINIAGGYHIYADVGNISVTALGASSYVQTGGNGNGSTGQGAIVAGGSGTATVTAGLDLLAGSPTLGTGDIQGWNVVLNAGRDIVLDGGTYVDGTDSVTATVGRNITLTGPKDQILSNDGPITLTTGAGGVLTNNGTVNSAANTGAVGGNITISADDMALNGPIDAAAPGIVTLEQSGTATRGIDLGGGTTAGDLDLSNTELAEITAGVLRIGRSDNPGSIHVTALLTAPSTVGLLHLITGGGITQSTNAGLDVTNLAVTAANTVNLGDKLNDITNLAVNMSGPGSVPNYVTVINGANTLTVPSGGLDGVLGITTNNAVISIFADGMNLNAPVNAGTFWVELEPFTTGRPIVLGTKQAGALALTNAELGNITTGNLHIGDFDSNLQFIPITITAPITAPSTWSTLELFSDSDSIRQDSGASITVKNLAVTASTGVYLTDPGNTVTNLGGSSNASFNFVNSTSLNIADVDPGADANGIQTGLGRTINVTVLGSGSILSVNARITTTQDYYSFPTITLSADDFAINAFVLAGSSGTVTLQQGSTTSRGIDLGGGTTPGELDLSDQELGEVIAGVLRIGRIDNAGNITVTAPVTAHPNYQTLSLISGGAVNSTNSAGPDVTVTNLAVQAADGINLDTAVSSLAFQNAVGPVSIPNAIPLEVGQVDGLSSSYNLGGNTTLSANGPIVFSENTASAGTLSVTTTETEPRTPLPPPEDNITLNSGMTVQSTGGGVDLQAADAISVPAKSQVLAPLGNISLTVGSGDDDNDASMTLTGTLSTGGDLAINVPTGNSATLTGTATATRVIENGGGSLFVNGPTGSVNANVMVNAGTLAGTGKISGTTTVEPGATLAPGNNGPGILTTGADTFSIGSTFVVRLGGPNPGNTAGSYGQLVAGGDVNLNNATLNAALTFVPGVTQTLTLIQATGNITGQFAKGTLIVLNGITYSIDYLPHSVVLAAPADLSVSVSGPSSAVEGGTASYVYRVSNSGPGAAENVVLSAPIPAGAVFLSASFGGGLLLPAGAYSASTGTVTLGALPAGFSGTLTLNVRLPEENPGITFTTSLASSTGDPTPANNTASVTTIVKDAPLTAQGRTVFSSRGAKTFTNVTVATFSDVNLAAAASDFAATINWGDGTVTTGQVVANADGTFSVIASHTYKDAQYKSYSLAIQIVDDGGSIAAAASTATVLPTPVRRP